MPEKKKRPPSNPTPSQARQGGVENRALRKYAATASTTIPRVPPQEVVKEKGKKKKGGYHSYMNKVSFPTWKSWKRKGKRTFLSFALPTWVERKEPLLTEGLIGRKFAFGGREKEKGKAHWEAGRPPPRSPILRPPFFGKKEGGEKRGVGRPAIEF